MDTRPTPLPGPATDAEVRATPSAGVSRRGFLATALASGFALAAQPVTAETITTDSAGLVAGPVVLPVAGGEVSAYRAMPSGARKAPVVLVIEEIFGVHAHIQDVCRRFAKLGYYAIAPELFTRQGDVTRLSDVSEILTKVISRVPDAQVLGDLDATLAYAGASGQADVSRTGIVGFCWGGRTVWLYAAHNRSVRAGVAFYGLLDGMKSDIKPSDPVDIAATLTVPVLGLYAEKDGYIQAAVVDRMQADLDRSPSGSQIVVFPGVNHGFHADYRPTYDRAAATYAWQLTRDWLTRHGV